MNFPTRSFAISWMNRDPLRRITCPDIKRSFTGTAVEIDWPMVFPLLHLSLYALLCGMFFKIRPCGISWCDGNIPILLLLPFMAVKPAKSRVQAAGRSEQHSDDSQAQTDDPHVPQEPDPAGPEGPKKKPAPLWKRILYRIYKRIFFPPPPPPPPPPTWSAQRQIIEDLARPNIFSEQKKDGKRHFLVVCHDQDIDRRIIQQVETLTAAGWSGVIVALSFDAEDRLEEKTGYLIHRIGCKHIVPDCKIYWLRHHIQYWIKRLFRRIPLFPRLLSKGNTLMYYVLLHLYYRCRPIKHPLPFDLPFYFAAEKYPADLILAEDLPALKASALLKKKWHCRLIFDSHEFYPEQRVFSSTQKKIMHGTTRDFIGECDDVITVSDGIAEKFSEFYGIGKPYVLHNVTMMENTSKSNKLHSRLNLSDDQTIILYQGGIIPKRNIEIVLKGFLTAGAANTHLVFLGPAAPQFLKKLKKIAGRALDRSVHFLDAVPREKLLAYTASADFGIIPYKVIDMNTKYCMPNKFFEFIQAGLPILSNDLIEVEKILNDIGGGGMIHDLDTPKNAADAIRTMLTRNLKHDHEVLLSAREKFSWNTESKDFEHIVTQRMNS